jgi:hypothetical protein
MSGSDSMAILMEDKDRLNRRIACLFVDPHVQWTRVRWVGGAACGSLVELQLSLLRLFPVFYTQLFNLPSGNKNRQTYTTSGILVRGRQYC